MISLVPGLLVWFVLLFNFVKVLFFLSLSLSPRRYGIGVMFSGKFFFCMLLTCYVLSHRVAFFVPMVAMSLLNTPWTIIERIW